MNTIVHTAPTKTTKLLSSVVVCNFIFFVSILFSNSVYGQAVGDYRSNANNMNWSATSSWQRWNGTSWESNPSEGYPGQNSGTGTVTIRDKQTVTLDVSPANAIVELGVGANGTNDNANLNFAANQILNVSGNVFIYGNNGNGLKSINVSSGILNVGGNLSLGTGAISNGDNRSRRSFLTIGTGEVNISGNLIYTVVGGTNNGSVRTIFNGNGRLNLEGSFLFSNNQNGSISSDSANNSNPPAPTTGNFNYNGSLPQTVLIGVGLIRYFNLEINNTHSSGATISAAITATNVLGNITVGNINSGSLFNTNDLAVARPANTSLTVAAGSTMNGGTTSIAWGEGGGAATINGTFRTANVNGLFGATNTAISTSNSPNLTLNNATSTVEYYATATQAVTARTDYANVILTGGATKTMPASTITASGNFTITTSGTTATANQNVNVGGNFTIGTGATFGGGAFAHTVGGNWSNSGTLTGGTSTITLNGTSTQNIGGSATSAFNNLTIANGSDLLVLSDVDIKIKGNLTVNGTMDAQTNPNTITFNGASQSIPAPTSGDKTGYHDLKIEQTSGNASLTGNTRIGGTLTLTSGNLNVGSNTLSLYGNYFAGDLSLLNVGQTSSLELRNTEGGTKTLPNFTALTNLIIDAPSSVFNLNQSATLYGNLSISNSQLNLSDKTLHRNTAGGNLTIGENGHLKIGGTNGLPQNFTTHSIHNTSTVEYAGTNQEISLPATSQKYGYLILSEAGTKKFPEAVNRIDVDQDMTVQNAAAFELDEEKNLVVKKQFINNGATVLFKDKSSLVQIDNVTNVGSITYQRKTRELKHLDFVYWGSMVNNRAIKDIWMTNANETFYQFNAATNAWQLLGGTTIMQPGRGYIARARYINGGWPLYNFPIPPGPPIYTSSFLSIPNNGNISVNVTPDRFNLLGNPYPSAIDMVEFAKQGFATVEEGPFLPTFYIWTQTTPITNNTYTGNDYAYYNVATNTATQVDTFTPTRYLNAGQAFFIRTKTTAPTSVVFTNEQRVVAQNNNFTKPGPSKGQTNPVANVMDRFWLNLRNTIQDFKQIAVVHIPNATNGYDTLLESPAFNGNTNMNFFSLIGTSRIGIQARASMVPEDEFPIGYQATTAGTYTIELANKEGVFSSHPIYLEDMLTNQVQNLQTGTYSFTTASGVHNNRFKIKYNNLTLSTNPFELQNIVVFISNETLHVKTGGEFIEKMEIYDIQGRLLQTIQGEASAQLEVALQMANQVILLKIKTTDGKTGTKKLIY